MRFFGDLAAVNSVDIVDVCCSKSINVINLEGSLVPYDKVSTLAQHNIVFNESRIIHDINASTKVVWALNNNHIFDVNNAAQEFSGLRTFGAKINNDDNAYFVNEDEKIVVLGGGWKEIGCKTKGKTRIVYDYESQYFSNLITGLRDVYKDYTLVLYLHWGYEREKYPLPLQREQAHEFINSGVDIIIGNHAHVIQGYERYRNGYIFYSIGNFFFESGYYRRGKLNFSENERFSIAIDLFKGKLRLLLLKQSGRTVELKKALQLEEFVELFSEENSFQSVGLGVYKAWFRHNRRHKKMIPVLTLKDPCLLRILKLVFLRVRRVGIDILVLFRLKF